MSSWKNNYKVIVGDTFVQLEEIETKEGVQLRNIPSKIVVGDKEVLQQSTPSYNVQLNSKYVEV